MKATWLTLLLPAIGVFHALGFFWMYGQFREAEGLLLVSSLVAVLLEWFERAATW